MTLDALRVSIDCIRTGVCPIGPLGLSGEDVRKRYMLCCLKTYTNCRKARPQTYRQRYCVIVHHDTSMSGLVSSFEVLTAHKLVQMHARGHRDRTTAPSLLM